eukprot:TRINITY_DN3228_c0_g1_i1.p1 TRINITY_DN3228_c0_g1~~TRINITY_DN3228_c0_g1_i1.p1  ORF type:complete len:702 (-),score=181.59 TRINITY_DN3228_c0_g1_i1:772-2877(-)
MNSFRNTGKISSKYLLKILLLASVSCAQNYNGLGRPLPVGSSSSAGPISGSPWQSQRPADMAKITDLEVMCGNSHMEVLLTFDRPFNGLVFSKGALDRYNCIYVQPHSGQSNYRFKIMYDSCGSKPDLNGKFYENNIVIQYDKDLIEVWDEAKRLRCEWYNDYEKGVTKAPIQVSDLEVVELNFRGDNVDCWMEIQQGKGPWASPVAGIVPLGTTLTMVVGIDDKQGEFDMRLKSCEASDSRSRPILLSDENGCVLRPKMISKFMKMKSSDSRATVVTYAFFHAFKFPDSMAVNIRCKVEICRYGCPEHCQNPGGYQAREREVSSFIGPNILKSGVSPVPIAQETQLIDATFNRPQRQTQKRLFKPRPHKETERKALRHHAFEARRKVPRPSETTGRTADPKSSKQGGSTFSDLFSNLQLPSFFGGEKNIPSPPPHQRKRQKNGAKSEAIPVPLGVRPEPLPEIPQAQRPSAVPVLRTRNNGQPLVFPSSFNTPRNSQGGGGGVEPVQPLPGQSGRTFPYGPRSLNLEAVEVLDLLDDVKEPSNREAVEDLMKQSHDGRLRRRKRSLVHSRKERSAELGVSSGYEVISEVDLAFEASDVVEDAGKIATFQGRIKSDEIVYGICLPTTSFSAIFILLALLTVISVLVSGFVCYQRQLQKVAEESAPKPIPRRSSFRTIFKQSSEGAKPKRKAEAGIPPPAVF